MANLWNPFLWHVLKRTSTCHIETHNEYICLGVRQRSQTIVILLACCIPEWHRDWKPTDHNICGIIVENCRDVIAWKMAGCCANKKAGFSNPSVTYHYKFHLLHNCSKLPHSQLCRVLSLFYTLVVPKIAVQSEAWENSRWVAVKRSQFPAARSDKNSILMTFVAKCPS